MLLDFPITLIYNPATPYTAGSLSLTSQGNATSNSSAAVAVNKVSLVATLPYTGLLPARLRKRQNLATNFSAVYVYAGGPTSLSQTPLLSQVSSLPGFLGSQRLPQLDQTPVGNVTWILTANEGAPWLLDISIDAGDYQSSFSTRLSFIISTGQPTYSGQGDLQALPWAMNSSIVDTAVFRASDFTAVWHVSRASNPSALCSSSFPVAATAEIFRVPLLVVENGTDFYKGEITSVDCSGNQPVHFKARVIFDDDPLLWRRRIAVTVALPEQKLNVIQDVVDEIDIRSGVLKYSSFNQTFSMNATTLVPAVLPTTNSTALQSASLIYHALAIRNVSLATDTW